jgi:hypothetical protein
MSDEGGKGSKGPLQLHMAGRGGGWPRGAVFCVCAIHGPTKVRATEVSISHLLTFTNDFLIHAHYCMEKSYMSVLMRRLKINHKRNVRVAFISGLLVQMQTLSYKTDLKILEGPLVTIKIQRELLFLYV